MSATVRPSFKHASSERSARALRDRLNCDRHAAVERHAAEGIDNLRAGEEIDIGVLVSVRDRSDAAAHARIHLRRQMISPRRCARVLSGRHAMPCASGVVGMEDDVGRRCQGN